jgi:hypothetical protein
MRKLRGRLVAAAALLGVLAAPSALAAPHNPKGEFEQFDHCPLDRKTVSDCVYSATKGGSVTIGEKTVPIVKPIVLQGGIEPTKGMKNSFVPFFAAEGAETLSKAPQPVPGGLAGIAAPASWPESFQGWFNEQINEGVTEVKATLELAAPDTSIKLSTQHLINQSGTTLGLPARIKLDNPILGDSCYIGSESQPIQIELTSGKSGATNGSVGNVDFNNGLTLVTVKGARLVSGTFAAPRANGCGGIFSPFIDPLVDSILGLPSPSGENAAILEGTLQSANAPTVRKSE